jgi:hypothetical protein
MVCKDINVNQGADVCKITKEQKKLVDRLECSDLIIGFRGRCPSRTGAFHDCEFLAVRMSG